MIGVIGANGLTLLGWLMVAGLAFGALWADRKLRD